MSDIITAVKRALAEVEVYVGGGAAIDPGFGSDVRADRWFGSIEALVEHLEAG